MANDIGSVKGCRGTSMALNGQAGQGTQKPNCGGNGNPGGTKPPKAPEGPVAMPK